MTDDKLESSVAFIDVPAFSVDEMEKALDYLKKEGYVRIKGVLSGEEVKEGTNLFWEFMENLGTGIKRDDLATWVNDNWPNTFSNGIIDQYGIGQSKFLWTIRAKENVRKVFAGLWGTDELLTSFDGCNAFRPTNSKVCTDGKGKSWKTKGSWYHIDQGAMLKGFQCVQGFVTLTDVNEVSGGLVRSFEIR